jgi:hypothetical protein
MTTKFYVVNHVNHDLTDYLPGSTISLDPESDAATELLEAGAIQTDPLDAEPEAAAPEEEQPEGTAQPAVGGTPPVTGEPSLDGEAPAASTGEAQDVTPEVSEKMTRADLEAAAQAAGIPTEAIQAAPTKAALVDTIAQHTATAPADEPAADPVEDPSANL